MLVEHASQRTDGSRLPTRARRTLVIFHRWGYAPTVDALGANLIGGAVPTKEVRDAIKEADDIVLRDDFVYMAGHEKLLEKSKRRVEAHKLHNGWARSIAEDYARDLARSCPLVDCICLSGSVSSGGYDERDDIDFDLFVQDDVKYLVYAFALLLGLRVSVRQRHRVGFRKIICINVLWTRSECQPFLRQDEDLAFELLQCEPLLGTGEFGRVLQAN